MQSAESISFLGHTAVNDDGDQGTNSILTVNFNVFSKGPAHVAGIIYTTNGWASTTVAPASFQGFNGDLELWKAVVITGGNNITFQYVIWCDDYAGVNVVPRIYNTNGGDQFSITSSF
jgi:hypothetical protein